MAIDFAADLDAIAAAGDLPAVTGSLTQDGATVAFASAVITDRRRSPDGGNKDRLELDVVLAAAGVSVQPRADAQVVLDPIAGAGELGGLAWLVTRSDQLAAGGPVTGFRLTLRAFVTRIAHLGGRP